MRIELTDRNYWLQEINQRLQIIHEERKKSDELFLRLWRKRKWLPDRKPDEFPEHGESFLDWNMGYMKYPCQDYWNLEQKLKNIQQALLTENTGVIYVNNSELEALRW